MSHANTLGFALIAATVHRSAKFSRIHTATHGKGRMTVRKLSVKKRASKKRPQKKKTK